MRANPETTTRYDLPGQFPEVAGQKPLASNQKISAARSHRHAHIPQEWIDWSVSDVRSPAEWERERSKFRAPYDNCFANDPVAHTARHSKTNERAPTESPRDIVRS